MKRRSERRPSRILGSALLVAAVSATASLVPGQQVPPGPPAGGAGGPAPVGPATRSLLAQAAPGAPAVPAAPGAGGAPAGPAVPFAVPPAPGTAAGPGPGAAAPVAGPATAPTTAPAPPTGAPGTLGSGGGPLVGMGSTRPAGGNGATGPSTQPGKISMNFQNASIDAVLMHLSNAAGFTVVKDPETAINGRINILSPNPVTPEEAISLLNTVLKDQGYGVVQLGRILKVLPASKIKKITPVRNIVAANMQQVEAIPQTDDLVTYVIAVQNIDATRLRTDLAPLLATDTNDQADITANAGSNSIVITDRSENIRRVAWIIYHLDQTTALASSILTMRLKNSDAASAAKLIQSIFQQDQTNRGGAAANGPGGFLIPGGGGPGGFGGFGGGFGGGGGGFGGGGGGRGGGAGGAGGGGRNGGGRGNAAGGGGGGPANSGRINAASDDRTNTIVVTGAPDTLKEVKNLLEYLDRDPVTENKVFIYPLRNAQASNLESVLNTLFGIGGGSRGSTTTNRLGSTGSTFGSTSGVGSLGSGRTGGTGTGSRRGSSSGGIGGSSSGFGALGGSSGFGGNTGSYGRTGTTGFGGFGGGGFGGGAATGGAGQLSGLAYVVADPDTNSLLVTCNNKVELQVKELIHTLDRPVQQVLIKVLVAEVTHDNSADFGVDFSVLNRRGASVPGATGNNATGGSGQAGGTTFGAPGTGLVVQLLETNVNATLHALAAQGKLDVLSRPYILASDNQPATITVGNEVPFITNSIITDTAQTINNIEYEDVGIILNVLPHINPDGMVIMDVAPEISALTGSTVPIGNGQAAPIIAKRAAQSRVGIRNGDTIVIGGLMEDRRTSTVSKVPILGDIPILRLAFNRVVDEKTKTELLIFLTPHVAPSPDTLEPMSREETRGTKLTPNAVEPGIFGEHVQNLKRGATPTTSTTQPETIDLNVYPERPTQGGPGTGQPPDDRNGQIRSLPFPRGNNPDEEGGSDFGPTPGGPAPFGQ